MLVLNLVFRKLKLYVFKITEQYNHELKRWIHSEFPKQYRGRMESKTEPNLIYLELLEVNLLHITRSF